MGSGVVLVVWMNENFCVVEFGGEDVMKMIDREWMSVKVVDRSVSDMLLRFSLEMVDSGCVGDAMKPPPK